MGKIISIMSKPIREFNLESRAHKVISRDKPTPAPKYKSDQFEYERLMKEYPKVFKDSLKKDEKLNKYLKDVYVTSIDPVLQAPQASSSADRPLPLNRKPAESFEFGFPEPDKIPYGRVTLRTALKFIEEHYKNPIHFSVDKIAEEYKLSQETVNNIIKYFKLYEVYIPQEKKVKANFVGPRAPRKQIITHKRKELPSGDTTKEDT